LTNTHKSLSGKLDPPLTIKLETSAILEVVLFDLNDFTASPYVVISPTGDSATISQNSFSPSGFLEHNPVFDPVKIIPRENSSLEFDYDFVKTQKNKDEFGAFLLDEFGTPLGLPFDFFTEHSSQGTVSFDLSLLSSVPVGLVFVITKIDSTDNTNDSKAEISNVRVITKSYPNQPSERKRFSKVVQSIPYNNSFR
jgi:hypothetical protein